MSRLLSQLDRWLAHHGETIYLRRVVGATPQSYVQCEMLAVVRALTEQQLVGGVSQQSYLLITSPTFIYRAQWPGGKVPAATGGIVAPTDPRLPITSDVVMLRGAQKSIARSAPVFDGGECVRIELSVLG